MTDLQKFIEAVKEDSDLHDTLSKYTDVDEFANKVVELGAERGFSFTVEDIQSRLAQRQTEGELSEGELDDVVGGESTEGGDALAEGEPRPVVARTLDHDVGRVLGHIGNVQANRAEVQPSLVTRLRRSCPPFAAAR